MPDRTDDLLLEVENLAVSFFTDEGEVKAVKDASLRIRRGRCLAVVGESGSGKTVLAYSILRLIQPPGRILGGRITLHGRKGKTIDVTALSARDDRLYQLRGGRVSMIFQEPMSALSPVHTVGNQICEAILLHQKLLKKEAWQLAVAMLGKVGIPDPDRRMREYPHQLSGGMRQRVVIAMALVCRPELLIADEPTTALDVTVQAQILVLIREMQRELDAGVLFITHDIGVVAQIADEVCVMYKGRVVEMGAVRAVLQRPLHPYTQGLLGAIPGTASTGRRLPTVDSILAGREIDRALPLLSAPDGRLVALPVEELAGEKV